MSGTPHGGEPLSRRRHIRAMKIRAGAVPIPAPVTPPARPKRSRYGPRPGWHDDPTSVRLRRRSDDAVTEVPTLH